jgi:hypothetical protein
LAISKLVSDCWGFPQVDCELGDEQASSVEEQLFAGTDESQHLSWQKRLWDMYTQSWLLEVFDEDVTEIEEDEGHRFIFGEGKAGRIGAERTMNVCYPWHGAAKVPGQVVRLDFEFLTEDSFNDRSKEKSNIIVLNCRASPSRMAAPFSSNVAYTTRSSQRELVLACLLSNNVRVPKNRQPDWTRNFVFCFEW